MKNVKANSDLNRRNFIKSLFATTALIASPSVLSQEEEKEWVYSNDYKPDEHHWGMCIDINECIGCGRCVAACKKENKVPMVPFFFRTWVERYRVFLKGDTKIDSPNGAINGFQKETGSENESPIRTFFVPKICNQCEKPPCVQVCPVGATFKTRDGVVLVDTDYCIGCRYCIQACPYGARFLHPETRTAEKCTFCYHRIVEGLLPACVENCPTQARKFGELGKKASPLLRFMRMNKIRVLKSALNTEPKVFYANLDMEVK